MSQWQVAALRPPHLAAICPWEGASDFYRDVARHGGILPPAAATLFMSSTTTDADVFMPRIGRVARSPPPGG